MSDGTSPAPAPRGLRPGEHRRIREEEWFAKLESCEPLHQWGTAFLVDTADSVWAYVRDPSGGERHTEARFDDERSERARDGVRRIEAASDEAARWVTRLQQQHATSLDDMRRQDEASARFVSMAEELYRELLTFGPRSD